MGIHTDFNGLPEHIPLHISPSEVEILTDGLKENGFRHTLFQILHPGQIFARIKLTEFEGKDVELHVRCFFSGKVEAEYEFQRLRNIVKHLSRRSYSAHEYLIKLCEELNINYVIDQDLRDRYNKNFPKEFPIHRLKFFQWFFIGVLIVTPIGLLWRLQYELRKFSNKLFSRNQKKPSESSETLSSAVPE